MTDTAIYISDTDRRIIPMPTQLLSDDPTVARLECPAIIGEPIIITIPVEDVPELMARWEREMRAFITGEGIE